MITDDVKQGRTITSSIRLITFTNAATQVVLPADYRVGLIISSHLTADIWLGSDAFLTSGNGLLIPHATKALILDIRLHGDIVQKGFWVIGSAGGTIGILESLLSEV